MTEKKNCITFQRITAVLLALVMLAGIIAFFRSDFTKKIGFYNDRIDAQKELVSNCENRIAKAEENISKYQQEKKDTEAKLVSAKDKVQKANNEVVAKEKALQDAEDALDTVCTRSYYSTWLCEETCKDFHNTVSNCKSNLEDAVDSLQEFRDNVRMLEDDIQYLEGNITDAKNDIKREKNRIEEINGEIKELKADLIGAWFIVIFNLLAMLAALGGMGLLIKNFFTGKEDKFTLYAVATIAASSLLFLIAGSINNFLFKKSFLLYLILSPHFWSLVVWGLFALILLKKVKKPVAIRNTAIVFSVITGILLGLCLHYIIAVLYAAALICTAFVFVPLVFTEYLDIAKHIFLSIITLGIWVLIWIYHVTKNLNKVETVEDRKPVRELLLSFVLPLYYLYWVYKTAESVENYGMENNKTFKIDVLCLAFSFVSPLFATVLIQNKINVVVGKPIPAKSEQPAETEVIE